MVTPSMVMPKPRATPWTKPNVSWTTREAAASPSTTGIAIAAITQQRAEPPEQERPIRRVEAIDSGRCRCGSNGAASRENRAVPLASSRAPRGSLAANAASDRLDRPFLGGDLEPAAAHLGEDQRTIAVGGEPHALDAAQLRRPRPIADEGEERAGRVGQTELRNQRRGRGLQPAEQTLQVGPQGADGEAVRCRAGRTADSDNGTATPAPSIRHPGSRRR